MEDPAFKRSPLSGGDINRAFRLTLRDGSSHFIKENSKSNIDYFRTEYLALLEMRRVGEIGIPEPLAFGTEGGYAYLLLPYLESGGKTGDYWQDFGRSLARFHSKKRVERYGFYEDNFIGATEQPNGWMDDWLDFFRERRLDYQINKASGYLDSVLSRRLLRLLDHLDHYLPRPQIPSLLHGDLWSGNILTGPDGKAWLIDPAAYYGHHEADLAMMQLFGSPPDKFFRNYSDILPIEKDFSERKDLYNLYHLLNHLNLFGASYLSSVRAVIERYA